MAELADALRSGRSGHCDRVGSNPSFGTKLPPGRGVSGVERALVAQHGLERSPAKAEVVGSSPTKRATLFTAHQRGGHSGD